MSYISGGTLEGVIRLRAPTPTPAVSPAGEGRIYFNGTQFLASENGAAYTAVVGGGGGGGWTDDGTVVRLTTVGDGVGIGTASPAPTSRLEVLGDATRVNVLVTGGNPGGAGTGGSLVYTAGAGGATGAGGVVGITGGAGGSTSGAAGGVSLLGGTPTDGNGGSVSMTGSAGLGTNRSGGNATVTCGNATGTGAGGVLQLTSGTSPTGTSGSIRLATGTTGATTERLRVNGAGTVFVGNGETDATPNAGTISATANSTAAGVGAALTVSGGTGNTTGAGGVLTSIGGTGGATSGTGGNNVVAGGPSGAAAGTGGEIVFQTATAAAGTTLAERMRVKSGGTIQVGDGTLHASYALTNNPGIVQVYSGAAAQVRVENYSATAGAAANVVYNRGRGTPASPTEVVTGDALGRLSFQLIGGPGTGLLNPAAQIAAFADGTISLTSSPGTLRFFTVSDGTITLVERAAIAARGAFLVGDGTLATGSIASGTGIIQSYGAAGTVAAEGFSNTATSAGNLIARRARGTPAATLTVVAGDTLGNVLYQGYVGAGSGVLSNFASISAAVPAGLTVDVGDSPGRLIFSTVPDASATLVERASLSSRGAFLVGDGTLNQGSIASGAGQFQVYSDTGGVVAAEAFSNTATNAGLLIARRARGTTVTTSAVVTGDALGSLTYQGYVGAGSGVLSNFASISAVVDGATVDVGDSPGRLVFSTTPDASATPVERMQIDNAGVVYVGNGATAASPAAGTVRATGGSGSGVAGALLTITGGPPGSGNANGGGLTLQAQPASGSGTPGELSLIARSQTVTLNDASNSSFTGSAAGATSLVGAINAVGGTGTGALRSLGSDRGTGVTRTLAVLPATLITAAGDRIELEARGSVVDVAGTISFGLGATTLFTSTGVAPGGAAYVASITIVRVTDTTVDWFATLWAEGSVSYAGGATAATVPSLTAGASNAPFCTASGTGNALNLVGTAVKA